MFHPQTQLFLSAYLAGCKRTYELNGLGGSLVGVDVTPIECDCPLLQDQVAQRRYGLVFLMRYQLSLVLDGPDHFICRLLLYAGTASSGTSW